MTYNDYVASNSKIKGRVIRLLIANALISIVALLVQLRWDWWVLVCLLALIFVGLLTNSLTRRTRHLNLLKKSALHNHYGDKEVLALGRSDLATNKHFQVHLGLMGLFVLAVTVTLLGLFSLYTSLKMEPTYIWGTLLIQGVLAAFTLYPLFRYTFHDIFIFEEDVIIGVICINAFKQLPKFGRVRLSV